MRVLFWIVMFLYCANTYAQSKPPKIIFDAKLSQVEKQGAKLRVASVKLLKNDVLVDSTVTQNGRCFFSLDTGNVYKVVFSKTGYVAKHLIIDTHGIPSEFKKKSKVKVDVGLFTAKKMLDVGFLNEKPIGIASYDYVEKKIAWNVEYTQSIIEELIKATLEYTEKKEKGKRKSL